MLFCRGQKYRCHAKLRPLPGMLHYIPNPFLSGGVVKRFLQGFICDQAAEPWGRDQKRVVPFREGKGRQKLRRVGKPFTQQRMRRRINRMIRISIEKERQDHSSKQPCCSQAKTGHCCIAAQCIQAPYPPGKGGGCSGRSVPWSPVRWLHSLHLFRPPLPLQKSPLDREAHCAPPRNPYSRSLGRSTWRIALF